MCTYYTGTSPWRLEGASIKLIGIGGIITEPSGSAYVGLSNGTIAAMKWKKNEFVQQNTLTGLTGTPTGIAVNQAADVFATNASSATISEFSKGAKSPTALYVDSNLVTANYLATDSTGDLYVEGQSNSGIEIDVLPAGGAEFSTISPPGQTGCTSGGLAVASGAKGTYLWVNDQGTASSPAAITRYLLKGSSLVADGSFNYSGVNGAIAVDPRGKDTSHVYAANNVPSGSQFATSAVEYEMPSGKVVGSSPSGTSSTEIVGISFTRKL
jgi:hypothetical protein